MFSASTFTSALLALALLSESALAGRPAGPHDRRPTPARAGLASKKHRRALKQKRVDDAQSSLQLDPSQIGPNLALTGNEPVPTAGQVDSLTSTNNFINFCLGEDVPLTNGTQIATGSCNQTPMGRIIASSVMPSGKFTFPTNGGVIKANEDFTVKLTLNNLDAGHFSNAQLAYYSNPQEVNAQGQGIGHSHVVIESIADFNNSDLSDPRKFAFFKGLNDPLDANSQLTVTVTGGLPSGFYKITTINSALTHQPLLVAQAQHGVLEDCVFFQVTDDGVATVDVLDSNGAANSTATATASASSDSATATATESASASDISATATATDSSSASDASATPAASSKKGKNQNADNSTGAAASDSASATDAASTSAAATEPASSSVTSASDAAETSSGAKKGKGGNKSNN